MNGRKIASLLQQGYRMPKPKHVDYELHVFEQPFKYNIGNKQPTFRLISYLFPCFYKYGIKTKCWEEKPDERSPFSEP